jgi:hypothetical protein
MAVEDSIGVVKFMKASLRTVNLLIKKLLLLFLFLPLMAHGKEQFACFWYESAPPMKLTLDEYRLTMEHAAQGQLPARVVTLDMLFVNTPQDQRIASISPCTLAGTTFTFGALVNTYCWKESTQQLWVGKHDLWEDANNETASIRTVYNCLKID